MPMAAAVPIMAGLGGILGIAGNTNAARTGTQNSTSTDTTNGTQTNSYSPTQMALQGTTAGALSNLITRGPDLTPAMTTGTQTINDTYKGIGDSLSQSLAARGFGNSGASGTAALQTGLARGAAVGNLQAQLQAAAQQQRLAALQAATGFSFANPNRTTTGTETKTTNGTYTNPGSPVAGGLSGLFSGALGGVNATNSGMFSGFTNPFSNAFSDTTGATTGQGLLGTNN